MSNIVVLHFRGGGSDKIWAICTQPNPDRTFTVWWGRRGGKLQCKKVSHRTWQDPMQSKLNKGYNELDDVTIDTQSRLVIPIQHEPPEVTVSTLWYRVSAQIPAILISDYLNITLKLLSQLCPEALERVTTLPTFEALIAGKRNGGAEATEGPLAILLLFGLRRYLTELGGSAAMQIADDENELLPERFADIEAMLDTADFSHSHDQLAIAMGCVDAPINLSVIRTETKAAFF